MAWRICWGIIPCGHDIFWIKIVGVIMTRIGPSPELHMTDNIGNNNLWFSVELTVIIFVLCFIGLILVMAMKP